MGKASKLKRIRRLNEVRLEEQKTLIKSGLGSASVELRKRTDNLGLVVRQNQSETKYSELLKYFMRPIIDDDDNLDIVRAKYILGVAAWNSAIMKEKSKKAYEAAKQEIASVMPDSPELLLLFEEMVRRKQDGFAKYKNIIVDFELQELKGAHFELSVASKQL